MPNQAGKITNSWESYRDCLRTVEGFLSEIRIQNDEAWIGEVCFGSPNQPLMRVPLSLAPRLSHFVEAADAISSRVIQSIRHSIETTRREMEKLKAEGEIDGDDSARLIARVNALEELLAALVDAASHSPITYHPATLIRWSAILSQRFVPGNPAVPVRVVTTYLL
jgi:hypothetical protein